MVTQVLYKVIWLFSKFSGSANSRKNLLIDNLFKYFAIFCTAIGLVILAIFIIKSIAIGYDKISWDFMSHFQSRRASKAGILAAWTGTVWIFCLTALIALPLGVGAGIYLEEYNKKGRLATILEINISNLAGVPSVIYGLLGMAVFVYFLDFGPSLLSGAFTLSLMIVPIIIVSTREALRAVPDSLRQAAFGMGATKWQMIWTQILPASIGGIMTGSILALSRIVGETAPLILIGAAAAIRFIPATPLDEFTVLPMQIYDWATRPQEAFQENAAAAIIILLMITFALNGFAIYFRNKWQKKINW